MVAEERAWWSALCGEDGFSRKARKDRKGGDVGTTGKGTVFSRVGWMQNPELLHQRRP